ncbi:MAG TPA: hypothetical protein VMH04_06680 [Candidatus Solibacter sp.]|nr:hypothetical protein [Candidatus Solibacter sp.]
MTAANVTSQSRMPQLAAYFGRGVEDAGERGDGGHLRSTTDGGELQHGAEHAGEHQDEELRDGMASASTP